jgi:CMP-N-acetylneuraminic acid synthetase
MSSHGALRVLALIPARGGSKSIPRKNTKLLAGEPLIAYSIAAALDSSCDRVIVSTDDPLIRRVALRYGAQAPFLRPAALAEDDTPDLPVFEHALNWLDEHEHYRPDLVVQLRPTSPLRPPGMVDDAVRALAEQPEADSLRTVAVPQQNPYKMWRVDGGYLQPLLHAPLFEPYNQPRQRLPLTYWQTGHIDVTRPDTIRQQRSMTGRRILPLIVDASYAVDIDLPEQWMLAERLIASDLPLVRCERTVA